ncbi:MAG TPA: 2-succinyl-6-hydroxy-2,4-cyclohexadiene-1-carboxylate synthase [Myxococcales bacterium]|nr:2-succinyl-6-hydroxy-2,4-cyclohexadiene-1-carboxylate synthase [Myxococcales bacterium]
MELALPCERWGRAGAPAVLMLHGFTGNRGSWRHLEPLLGSDLQAVAVDLPGHGDAPLPSAPGPRGFEEALAALERVVDQAGAGPVAVLGYSQGARLALGLALRAPGKVSRLILESVNPGLNVPRERRARERDDEALASKIVRGGVDRFLRTWEALPLFQGLRQLPAGEREALHRRRASATPEGLAGALRALGLASQPSYWDHLPRLRLPVLLLTGARDRKFTELSRRAVRELPLAWHRAFEGCHHAPHLESPAAYAAEVRGFLDVPWSESERGRRLEELAR